MVGFGTALFLLAVWYAWIWWRRRDRLADMRWFLRAAVAAPVAAYICVEAGWIVTEVGRQPWVVYEIMRTEDAVTDVGAAAVWTSLSLIVVLYTALAVGAVLVIRGMTRRWREGDLDDSDVPYGPREPLAAPGPRDPEGARVSAVDACAVILLAGVVLYALLGGADFGAGFWDLTAGGDRRGEAPRALIDRAIGPVWEAEPRLADLRAGGHVDRVPRGLQLDPVHPVHPVHPGGARHHPARGGLRLPQGLDPARGAPRLRGDLRHRLGAHALLPRRHPRRDRLRARARGQRRRRHLDELGQPVGGDGRGAGGGRSAPTWRPST